MGFRLRGLIAATYTPFQGDGSLRLEEVPRITEHLLRQGVEGLYVCGSTGEGVSLTTAERREVAAAYVGAAAGRVPVVVQVGHNSLADARDLAAHAREVGVDAVSATAPSYFGIGSVELLADCMADVAAAAPDLPFYYYHIPALTGVVVDLAAFLRHAGERIPNLAGVKYTSPTLDEFQRCTAVDDGRFDLLWGLDEMLLAALGVGARGAVGSTYNIAAPLYRRVLAAFDAGDHDEARRLQLRAVEMIDTIARYPFHPAMKVVMRSLGLECGECRLPLPRVDDGDARRLLEDLERIGFHDWAGATG